MEKSRPRSPHPEIIDRRDLKSISRKILEGFITLAFWAGFLYILVPLVTLCLWIFGVQIAYTQLIGAQAFMQLLKIMKGGGLTVLLITLLILGWGYYNYLCFRIRGERRIKQVLICFDEDFAARYHLDLPTLQTAKEQTRLLVTLAHGRVAVLPTPEPSSLNGTPDQFAIPFVIPPDEPTPSLQEDLSERRFKWHRKAGRGRK
ncbi:MAG: poly-beta-1,6-N-acetyl-D-glucosamine biosynthesis protein PgaD [Deltaproteobacteria bacterium]|jgi:poly-beta-1,6-N-acetyl-D-glucosamine biosynthesis protein PgaD